MSPVQIRLVRQALGVTSLALSIEAGVDGSTVSRIENGVIKPKAETLRRIEQALARLHARQVGVPIQEAL